MDILIAFALGLSAADPALAGAPPPPPGTERISGDIVYSTHSRAGRGLVEGRVHPAPAHPFPPPPAIRQGHATVTTASGYGGGETYASRRLSGAAQHGATRGAIRPGQVAIASRTSHAGSGRRTVTLGADFFLGGLTGGVEGPAAPVYYGYGPYGRGVVVITGAHRPRSAGQAAAALGLPRG